MARSRKPEPLMTLEERLDADRASTGGTMPIVVGVADEAERRVAERLIAGKRHAKLLTFETEAEATARRARTCATDQIAGGSKGDAP